MKQQSLLHGPFTQALPNYANVDTTGIRSNVVDFTIPVDGMESPWRRAQIVFVYDGKRVQNPPRSVPELLAWAKKNPGRLTHPSRAQLPGLDVPEAGAVRARAPIRRCCRSPPPTRTSPTVTAPLWAWYDELRPALWRKGEQFPENGPAQRQLLNDGEIDMHDLVQSGGGGGVGQCGPAAGHRCARSCSPRGTIGNTSFVAIPYNAANKEGAMVVADFLLEPATQAHAQDIRQMGNFSVLDFAKLSAGRAQALRRPAEVARAADQRRARTRRCSSRIRRG